MALEQTCAEEPKASESLDPEALRELLVNMTTREPLPKEGIPAFFIIEGLNVFLTPYAPFYYNISDVRLHLPRDEAQLRADIKFVKERVY